MLSHTQLQSPAQKRVIGAATPCSCTQLALRPQHAKRSALRWHRPLAPPTYSGCRPCQGSVNLQCSIPAAEPAGSLAESLQSPTEEGWSWRHPSRTAGLTTAVTAAVVLASCLAAGPAAADAQALLGATTGPIVPGLLGDSPLREGLVSGFLLIFFSELGDKTFFIAVLLALKYPQKHRLVFAGAFGALAVMTVISVGLGLALHEADQLIDTHGVPLDDLVAVALLLFFGVRTLQDAATADERAKEEEEGAAEATATISNGAGLFFSIFALVFAAEWGDKSFLATIALAASSSPLGVIAGAVSGHAAATVLAIAGGSVLSEYVSEKTVQYVGGSLFLLFAASTVVDIARGV